MAEQAVIPESEDSYDSIAQRVRDNFGKFGDWILANPMPKLHEYLNQVRPTATCQNGYDFYREELAEISNPYERKMYEIDWLSGHIVERFERRFNGTPGGFGTNIPELKDILRSPGAAMSKWMELLIEAVELGGDELTIADERQLKRAFTVCLACFAKASSAGMFSKEPGPDAELLATAELITDFLVMKFSSDITDDGYNCPSS